MSGFLNETIYMASLGPDPPQQVLNMSRLQRNQYRRLLGRVFQATFMGRTDMQSLQTGTGKYILSITQGAGDLCFTKLLSEILNDMPSQPFGKPIWKAITSTEDTTGQNDYQLWVEAEEGGLSSLPATYIGNFKVERCTVEIDPRPSSQFSHIARIWVSVI